MKGQFFAQRGRKLRPDALRATLAIERHRDWQERRLHRGWLGHGVTARPRVHQRRTDVIIEIGTMQIRRVHGRMKILVPSVVQKPG